MLIQTNGIRINYEWSGKKGKEVVVFSHSLGLSLAMWNPQCKALAERFSILRYDMRGHGGSDVPNGPYTLELLGEDVIALMNALGIDKAHYVGLSIGGMIGQYLGLAHPKRFHTLTLSNTSSTQEDEIRRGITERIDIARQKGLQELVQPTMERWFTPSFIQNNSLDFQMVREQFLKTPVEGYIGCCHAIRGLNYVDRISGIALPTLVIAGKEEVGTAVPRARAIHERIAGSKFVLLSPAQHISNVECPEKYNAALVEFLSAHPGSA